MSQYNWSCLEKHKSTLEEGTSDVFFGSSVKKIKKNGSLRLPETLESIVVSGSSGIRDVLCFFDDDFDILDYPHRITCIYPKHTPVLRYLVDENPDKWFWATIDDSYHLRLPIDTLQKIRIVEQVCISVIDNFSWSIMAVEQEKLFYDIYSHKLNTGEISVPKELLDDYKNTDR